HGLQHLGRHDDWLSVPTAQLDSPFLNQWDFFERQFNTQVTTGNHYAIKSINNLCKVVDSLRLLNLRNDWNSSSLFTHNLTDVIHIGTASNKRQRDEVSANVQRPPQIFFVLLRQCRDRYCHTGKVDSLVVRNRASNLYLGHNTRTFNSSYAHRDTAVINQ